MSRIRKEITSDSFQQYEIEFFRFAQSWQYYESASLKPDERFDIDKEAYIKTFFESPHITSAKFDEKRLLDLLIINIEKAKATHPVWLEYLDFLIDKKKKYINKVKLTKPGKKPVAIFCRLLRDSGLRPQNDMIPADFCSKICEEFDIEYSDKIRQEFNHELEDKYLKQIKELIFPRLKKDQLDILESHINKLYH